MAEIKAKVPEYSAVRIYEKIEKLRYGSSQFERPKEDQEQQGSFFERINYFWSPSNASVRNLKRCQQFRKQIAELKPLLYQLPKDEDIFLSQAKCLKIVDLFEQLVDTVEESELYEKIRRIALAQSALKLSLIFEKDGWICST